MLELQKVAQHKPEHQNSALSTSSGLQVFYGHDDCLGIKSKVKMSCASEMVPELKWQEPRRTPSVNSTNNNLGIIVPLEYTKYCDTSFCRFLCIHSF